MMVNMPPLEHYLRDFGDTLNTRMTYYRTYLIQTDYVAAKLAEATYLGQPMDEKYQAVLEQRAEARRKIEELEGTL